MTALHSTCLRNSGLGREREGNSDYRSVQINWGSGYQGSVVLTLIKDSGKGKYYKKTCMYYVFKYLINCILLHCQEEFRKSHMTNIYLIF